MTCCCWAASVMSDSVRPHRRQPTRLPRPWDSPGKNTGVGCHFLLQCMKGKSEREVSQSCPTLGHPMDCSPPGSSVHGISQARILEWVAMPSSRGIFPTQGSNPHLLHLPHWQADSLPLAPPRKPQCTLESALKSQASGGQRIKTHLPPGFFLPRFSSKPASQGVNEERLKLRINSPKDNL